MMNDDDGTHQEADGGTTTTITPTPWMMMIMAGKQALKVFFDYLRGREVEDKEVYPEHVKKGEQTPDQFMRFLRDNLALMEVAKAGGAKRKSESMGRRRWTGSSSGGI